MKSAEPLFVLLIIVTCGLCAVLAHSQEQQIVVHPRFFEVTWYQDGEYTATGDVYRVENFTCAVRDRTELRHWIRFEYNSKVIYCWANDLMPENARAEYDLTPAAFMKLEKLKVGRLKGVKVQVVK